MPSLILYTTDNCSLCDTAFDFLAGLPQLAGVTLTLVDIALPDAVSQEAFERLGPRIPVLAVAGVDPASSSDQLAWPFTALQVVQLLEHQDRP